MLFKKFAAALMMLIQVSQAIPSASSARLGKPCDGKTPENCNEDGGVEGPIGPNAFKVRCENGTWVKGTVCEEYDICQYYPGFKKAMCISTD